MADKASEQKQGEGQRRRRGRPPGSTTKKRRHLLSSPTGDSESPFSSSPNLPLSLHLSHKLLQRYQEASKLYEKSGLTQRIQHILRRIACGRVFAMETQRGPVLQYLTDVCKLLFCTELELVVWELYLTGTQWGSLPMSFQTLLVVSGYYVKSVMNIMETSHILAHLAKQIPQFHAYLAVWSNCCGGNYSVNPKELHQRFRTLLAPLRDDESRKLNYNYYIDDIINLGTSTVDEITASQPPIHPFTLQEADTEPDSLAQLSVPGKDLPLPSPLVPLEDFGFSPLLFPYPFAYFTPPQSALPVLEDLESAQLRPVKR